MAPQVKVPVPESRGVGLLGRQVSWLLEYNRRIIEQEPALAQRNLLLLMARYIPALPQEVMLALLQGLGVGSLLWCRPLFRLVKYAGGFSYMGSLSAEALAKNDRAAMQSLVAAWVVVWAVDGLLETIVALTTTSSVVLYDVLGLWLQLQATSPATFALLFPSLAPPPKPSAAAVGEDGGFVMVGNDDFQGYQHDSNSRAGGSSSVVRRALRFPPSPSSSAEAVSRQG